MIQPERSKGIEMIDSGGEPKLTFSVWRNNEMLGGGGREYIAIGVIIADGRRTFRMTLPIDPPIPQPATDEDLLRAGMTSLRDLYRKLPLRSD